MRDASGRASIIFLCSLLFIFPIQDSVLAGKSLLLQSAQSSAQDNSSAANNPRLNVQIGNRPLPVSGVFCPDGNRVITVYQDGLAVLWDLKTGGEIRRFGRGFRSLDPDLNQTDPIKQIWREVSSLFRTILGKAVAVSRDGKTLFTYNGASGARLWDITSGSELAGLKLEGYSLTDAEFSPEGDKLLFGFQHFELNKTFTLASLWDIKSGKELRQFKARAFGGAFSVAFSPDARTVITGEGPVDASLDAQGWNSFKNTDVAARLWDVDTGRVILELRGHSKGVVSVAFFNDGRRVVTGSADGTVRIWSVSNGETLQSFEGHKGPITSIKLSTDNSELTAATEDGDVIIWDVVSGQIKNEASLYDQQNNEKALEPIFKTYLHVVEAFSPDGKLALTRNSQVWDLTAKSIEQSFTSYSNKVIAVNLPPDNYSAVIGSSSGKVQIWDLERGRVMREFGGEIDNNLSSDGILFSKGGQRVYIDRNNTIEHTVSMWNIGEGRKADKEIKGITYGSAFALSSDEQYLLAAVSGNPSSKAFAEVWDLNSGMKVRSINLTGSEFVSAAAFSPDGKTVATGETREWDWRQRSRGLARIWDIASGKELNRFAGHSASVISVAFSPGGSMLLTGSEDGTARLWNTRARGSELQRFIGHVGPVTSGAFSPDKQTVATGGADGSVRLWTATNSKEIRRLQGHSESVTSLVFSSDGTRILSGSNDATARLWDCSSGNELARLVSLKGGTWVVTTPDGRFDTNNLEEVKGLNWIMPDEPLRALPLNIFMRDYYEPRLLPRVLNGEKFKAIRPLSSLNRAQPVVRITNIEQHKDNPEMVSVSVEASEGVYESQQGLARTSGIYDLRLFRDGQMVAYDPKSSANIQAYLQRGKQSSLDEELKVWRSITRFTPDPKTENESIFTVRLPRNRDLAEVEFSAYAFNDDRVKSETYRQTYRLPRPLKASVKGKAYLITIGVAENEDRRWNLFYPANDARSLQKDLYDRLSKRYDKVVRVPLVSDYGRVTKLFGDCLEKKPTREAIRTVFDLLAGRDVGARSQLVPCATQIQKAQPEDIVLISFSGHGYGDNQGNFYLFPYDTGKESQDRKAPDEMVDELLNRLISSEELSAWMRDIDAGDIVMILDACQSEAATGAEFKPGPMGSRGLGQLAYDKGMRMIVATQADNQAVGPGALSHGLLTFALLEGLGNNLSLEEWFELAAERVPKLYEEKVPEEVKRLSKPQRPSVLNFSRRRASVTLIKNN